MGESYLSDDGGTPGIFANSGDPPEASALYTQISYEELEACVLSVRDSISEFYLAPQGEISFAAVEAALAEGIKSAPASQEITDRLPQASDGNVFIIDAASGLFPSPDAIGGVSALTAAGEGTPGDAESDGADWPPGDAESDGALQAGNRERRDNAAGKLKLPYTNALPIRQLYRESVKKRDRKRRAAMLKFLAACFGGTIFGGLLMFLCLTLVFPAFGISVFSLARDNIHEVIHTIEYEKDDTRIEAIYSKVSPCVVGIRVLTDNGDSIFGRQQTAGSGSGIIIRRDGYILTSNSVVASYAAVYSSGSRSGGAGSPGRGLKIEITVQRDPEVVYQADLVARDVKTDIAILKIDADNLPMADLGDSDQLKHGEMVIAIGRPAGTDSFCSVTDGIISGFNRGETSLIQTNAAINPENSGGALVNSRGQIIGVNVITTDSTGYGALCYAIPINSARLVADNLLDYSYVRGRAKTGIGYSEAFNDNFDFYKKQYADIPRGVYVEYVEPLSGAFKAGVRAGDIITKMNGEDTADYHKMLAIKDTLAPGDIITVEVYRDEKYFIVEIEVSEETGGD